MRSMEKILISSCLLGHPVRYDGTGKTETHSLISQWSSEDRLVPICPEVCGGLPVPRPPAEIQNSPHKQTLSVITNTLKIDF